MKIFLATLLMAPLSFAQTTPQPQPIAPDDSPTQHDVYHYPDVPEQAQPLSASKLVERIEMTQRYVRPPVAGRFLFGEFRVLFRLE